MTTIDPERLIEAIESGDYIGFCRACGAEHCNVEPDACHYKCNECGADEVFSAEELLIAADISYPLGVQDEDSKFEFKEEN